MSMLDSFFNKGFKGPKCKTLLKLTIPRIKLLRNRREIQIKQMRRDIAKLLETGQEATARIRVEHIIREENMMAAQEIVELFCELISVRIPIIETQRECPLDLKEAISSVCFAAPRCADLPELMHVQMLFASKYGKEFVAAATELRPDCGVNRQLIELLSVRAPAPEKRLKLLTEIAEEHGLDWDPIASENEILKKHEDLLNGPSQFTSASVLPLPKEKHEETLKTITSQGLNEQYGAVSDFDGLDFPEVPKVSLRPKVNEPLVSPTIRPVSAMDSESSEDEADESTLHQSDLKQEETAQRGSVDKIYNVLNEVQSVDSEQCQSAQSYMPPVIPSSSFSAETDTTVQMISQRRSDVNVDLQDVLAAAQAAADSAERAASAARSAASLAQMRITELVMKKNGEMPGRSSGFSSHKDVADEQISAEKANFVDEQSTGGLSVSHSPLTDKRNWDHPNMHPDSLSDHVVEVKFDSYSSFGNGVQPDLTQQQPQRCTSLDDDTYFAYPDLFSSKCDNAEVDDHSASGKSGSL
uniref:IST1-like protein n=2 Tax=Kalanchoe fedtschenkoi TaxID=63787 RepID=A0A7N0U0Y3_KALFE